MSQLRFGDATGLGADAEAWAVGDNTLDVYLGQDGFTLVGGNAANVAVQLGRAGADARYAGAIGDDPAGKQIRVALEAQPVGLDALVTLPGASAVTDIRTTEDGDRVFEREEFGVTEHYYPDQQTIARMREAAWVHIGMLPEASRLRAELKDCAQPPVISQDMAVASGLEHLDVAVYSHAGEASAAAQTAQSALDAGVALAVVTLGAEGSIAFPQNGAASRQPAHPTTVVDTTGAGDSFIAGLIAALLARKPLDEALDAAAALAARTCSHLGGWPQLEDR